MAVDAAVLAPYIQYTAVVALEEGGFCRFGQSRQFIASVGSSKSVDQQFIISCFQLCAGHALELAEVHKVAISIHKTRITFLTIYFNLLHKVAPLRQRYGGCEGHARTYRVGGCCGQYIFFGVALHKLAAYGRVCLADAAEQHAQVIIYFSGGTYGRTRISCAYFLFNGNCRWQTFYRLTFRLLYLAHELAGVSRQALDIPAASFCIEGVECQRRLAAARQSGNDNELVAGQLHIHIFEIVDSGPFYNDIMVVHQNCILTREVTKIRRHDHRGHERIEAF